MGEWRGGGVGWAGKPGEVESDALKKTKWGISEARPRVWVRWVGGYEEGGSGAVGSGWVGLELNPRLSRFLSGVFTAAWFF